MGRRPDDIAYRELHNNKMHSLSSRAPSTQRF